MTAQQRQSIRQRIQAEFRFVPQRQHAHQRDNEPQATDDAPDLRSVDKHDPRGTPAGHEKRSVPDDRPKPRRLGPQIAERNAASILRDYLAGEPIAGIARRLRISDDAVSGILRKHVTPDQKREHRRTNRRKNPQCRAVACVERPELVFACVSDAAEFLGYRRNAVAYVLDHANRKCGGYHWRRVEKREDRAA